MSLANSSSRTLLDVTSVVPGSDVSGTEDQVIMMSLKCPLLLPGVSSHSERCQNKSGEIILCVGLDCKLRLI